MKLMTLTGKLMLAMGFAAIVATSPVYAGMESKAFKEVAPIVEEEESWWSASLAAGYDSIYLFRGVNLLGGSGLVWTDLSFSTYGFTLGAWFADGWTATNFNELDVYASYGWSLGPVDVEGGFIWYYFPTSDTDTWEIFASVSTGAIPYVTPALSWYYDFDAFEGHWVEFSLSSSIPVVEDVISIDPFAAISYDFEYNSGDNDWNNVELGVEVPIAMNEYITLSGYAKYSWALDAIESFQDDEWVVGGAITFSF